MNFYAFHIGDYVVHTRHLTLMEDLAYRRLLDLYYTREKLLPGDAGQVARLVGMSDHVAEVQSVLTEFFGKTEAGEWKHDRCDAEIARMQDKQAKAKASAQASVNARSANAQRPQKKRSATKTITNTKTTLTPQPPSGGFDGFWKAWPSHPRKTGEDQCRAKWIKQECDEIDEQIIAHVEAMKQSEGWLKDKGQFIPAPLVYLNQKRWTGATESEAPGEWHETRGGIEKKAAALGIPKWDELSQFSDYKARVIAAAGAQA